MNPLKAWNRFWFGPISARPLGVYRILFGTFVLIHLGLLLPDLDYWYSGNGLLQGNEAATVAGELRFSPLQYVQDPFVVRCVLGATAACATLFLLGWRTRIVGVLLYLGLLSLYNRNLSTNSGPDQLMMITMFYLMLSPCGAAFSLDARREARRRGAQAEPLIVPWAQRLMQIQLCLIYFATAAFKCNGTTWLTGTAIHYVLFNHEVGQANLEWLAGYPITLSVLTLAALVVEFALAFLLWFRPSRKWIAVLGLVLHAGIVPLVNVPLFGEQMTGLYLLFLAPDELASLLRFLNPLSRFGRRAAWTELPARPPRPALAGWRQLELAFQGMEPVGGVGQGG